MCCIVVMCYTTCMRTVPKLHEELVAVATWLALCRKSDLCASTLHVPRQKSGAGDKLRLGDTGVHAPHFLCFAPRGLYAGCALIVKRRDASRSDLTPKEIEWAKRMVACGWYVEVVKGAADAIDTLGRYDATVSPAGLHRPTGELRLPEGWSAV